MYKVIFSANNLFWTSEIPYKPTWKCHYLYIQVKYSFLQSFPQEIKNLFLQILYRVFFNVRTHYLLYYQKSSVYTTMNFNTMVIYLKVWIKLRNDKFCKSLKQSRNMLFFLWIFYSFLFELKMWLSSAMNLFYCISKLLLKIKPSGS